MMRGVVKVSGIILFLLIPGQVVAQESLEERVSRLEKLLSEQQEEKEKDFRVHWKEGLRFDTHDKTVQLKIGGRINTDFVWIDESDKLKRNIGEQNDEVEFRRARIYLAGTIYERVIFKSEYDFTGGDADFKDVYLGLTKVPVVGNIRVGHFKEPMSLEQQTSGKYITFLERSVADALVPGRNTGAMVHNTECDGNLTWAIGAFKTANDFGETNVESQGAVTARITGTPWRDEESNRLIHVGLSGSYRANPSDSTRFRARPEINTADRFVDTLAMNADETMLWGAEAAVVCGPFSAQAEYLMANVESDIMRDPTFSGFYVYGSVFLTPGDRRPYSSKSGSFGRVKPQKNAFTKGDGIGAIELAGRFSTLDLDSESVNGGELDNYTFGVNWYLNPNTRIMLNLIRSNVESNGNAEAATVRFAIDF